MCSRTTPGSHRSWRPARWPRRTSWPEFLLTMIRILGIYAAVHGVQVVMRLYAEELEYRADPLLGGATTRQAHLASHAVIAFVSTAVGMVVAGSVMGWVADSTGDTIGFADVLGQALATIPAVWVLVGLALAVVGAKPSRRLAGWMAVVATFALTHPRSDVQPRRVGSRHLAAVARPQHPGR
jgi:Putative exporter of polyketide antibiotics